MTSVPLMENMEMNRNHNKPDISWSRIVVTQIIIANLLHKLWCTLQNWRFYPLVPLNYMLPLFWTPKSWFKTRWNQPNRRSAVLKPTQPEIFKPNSCTAGVEASSGTYYRHLHWNENIPNYFTSKKKHHKENPFYRSFPREKKNTKNVYKCRLFQGKRKPFMLQPDCPKKSKNMAFENQSHPKNTRVFWLCFLIFLLSFPAPILQTSTSTSKMP